MNGMNTIKERDLTQGSSASWVRAIDSAGNSIKINAADLMALMPIATDNSKGLANNEMRLNITSRYTGGSSVFKICDLSNSTFRSFCLTIDIFSNTASARYTELKLVFGVGNAGVYGCNATKTGYNFNVRLFMKNGELFIRFADITFFRIIGASMAQELKEIDISELEEITNQ